MLRKQVKQKVKAANFNHGSANINVNFLPLQDNSEHDCSEHDYSLVLGAGRHQNPIHPHPELHIDCNRVLAQDNWVVSA